MHPTCFEPLRHKDTEKSIKKLSDSVSQWLGMGSSKPDLLPDYFGKVQNPRAIPTTPAKAD
jgi:hypothetical protein